MTSKLANQFAEDGYFLGSGFYDYQREIKPIQEGIRDIISLVAAKYEICAPVSTAEEAMTRGYATIVAVDRKYGGEIYDAIKQIPEFVQLVVAPKNIELFKAIRAHSKPGVAAGGHGIRIDNPEEERFRTPWHQEFPAQLRSLDGLVFWSPLMPVHVETGPVELCPGSHKEGPIPVYEDDQGVGKTGAYAMRLHHEAEILKKYTPVAPLTNPGDLLIMDFLTLHASGRNVSDAPRWTMQWRLFNFADPVGIKIGWRGSFASGIKFQDIVPELVANPSACFEVTRQ
jgi:ectoine hydroxylase-related dioxygenase (phytanoyl-CoA dioxygenase family)